MLVGLRDGEGSPIEGSGIEAIGLQPLDDRDAREMVARLAPDLAPAARDRIIREAAGNPLALAELSTAIRDDPPAATRSPTCCPQRPSRARVRRAGRRPSRRHPVADADRRPRRP
jgi:hypothetical protein